MEAVIIYESLFGNTRAVAEAIAEGVRHADQHARVRLVRAGEAEVADSAAVDLLIVGGPTHVLRMSSERTRQSGLAGEEKKAESQGQHLDLEPGAEGPGLREWFASLAKVGAGHRAAAFDTRMGSHLAGGAAHGIARKLRHHGYEMVAPPQGFVVEGTEGPLSKGERARAQARGAAQVPAPARTHV
ncbi:MAG: flavodoxin family protein [Oryzihumus sp.]